MEFKTKAKVSNIRSKNINEGFKAHKKKKGLKAL